MSRPENRVSELEAANAELLDALRHLAHNVKSTKKRLDLGLAMYRAESIIRKYKGGHE